MNAPDILAPVRAAVEKHKPRTARAVLEIDGFDWPVTIEYDAAPSEPRTRNCAGYPGYVDIIRVVDDATGKPIPLPAKVIESLTKDIREGAI